MKLIQYTLALLTAASLTSCGDDFLNEFDKQVITSDQVKEETEKNPDKALSATTSTATPRLVFTASAC